MNMYKNFYRNEIDTIRGVSVLLVFAYHTKILKSGFIGVDLFFVVSGFLITSIILNEINNNTFSLTNFLTRRARRIWPVLFIVILISIFINFFIMNFDEYKDLNFTIVGTSIGLGNFFFNILQLNYFSYNSEIYTLLHTWSLSVEEQFYFFFSCLVFFLSFKKKKLKIILLYLSVILLIIGAIFISSQEYEQRNFYLTQYRFLPILLGVITAILCNQENKFKFKFLYLNNFFSILMILLIVIYVFIFEVFNDRILRLLSFNYSILPSLFLCSFLYFYNKNYYTKFLFENKLLNLVGLTSYSFYLIHFIIISFTYIFYKNFIGSLFAFNAVNICFIFIISFSISFFSWKYIEVKFRDQKLFGDKLFCLYFFISLFIILIFSNIVINKNGFQNRFLKIQDVEKFFFSKKDKSLFLDKCRDKYEKKPIEINYYCFLGKENKKDIEFALIGDSFKEHYETAFDELGKKNNFSIINFLGCEKFEDFYLKKECTSIIDNLKHFKSKNIILSFRWTHRFFDRETGTNKANSELIKIRTKNLMSFVEDLKKLNLKVYIIYPSPEYEINVPNLILMRTYLNDILPKFLKINFDNITLKSKKDFYKKNIYAFEILNTISNISRIYPELLLCDLPNNKIPNSDLKCYVQNKDFIFYFDEHHITNSIAKIIVNKFYENF
jgi:peptidoglycan/LPS O-acetylase OafA/YrhL